MCCLPGFYRQKPPFANRWNSDVCFSLRIWCTAGLACGDFKPELVFNDEIRAGERFGRYRQRARQARHVSGQGEDGVAHPRDGRRRRDRRRANCTRSRLRKVSARRIEADRFKSWTRPDRKIPGYRVRKSWQPRRIFYRGWRRMHSGSLIHRAEPPAGFVPAQLRQ